MSCCRLMNSPHRHHSFFTLSGMYFSLQYLSLSDATALTFISPILTGFSGAVFLKEALSFQETFSGCMCSYTICTVIAIHGMLVCSFFGVILIARPPFLFGSPSGNQSEVVTPRQRMLSISLEGPCPIFRCSFSCYCTVLLSSASWGRRLPVSLHSIFLTHAFISLHHRHPSPRNRETSSYASLSLVLLFAMCPRFYDRVRPLFPFLKDHCDVTGPSMIAFKIPPVIPTQILWLVMLPLISIFGLFAQVCLSTQHPFSFLI